MQITGIEVELGVTINAGDFQSVKSTVKMRADLYRNEDSGQATAALQTISCFLKVMLLRPGPETTDDSLPL